MGTIATYLKLFRWPNLIIIVLTQLLIRYAILVPNLQTIGQAPALGLFDFFILVTATVLLCAAGYAINDYFDIPIDRINRPHSIILGRVLSRRNAIFSHTLLNLIAVSLAVYLSFRYDQWVLAPLFLAGAMMLWMYSIRLKKTFLIGNGVVALLSAFVIGIVWLVEYLAVHKQDLAVADWNSSINHLSLLYGLFAMMTSLIREIIKDMEDKKGDSIAGCQSIPLRKGVKTSRNIILILTSFLVIGMGIFQITLWIDSYYLLTIYLLLFTQLPLLFLLKMVFNASEPSEFRKPQQLMKLIMLAGILSMLFFLF